MGDPFKKALIAAQDKKGEVKAGAKSKAKSGMSSKKTSAGSAFKSAVPSPHANKPFKNTQAAKADVNGGATNQQLDRVAAARKKTLQNPTDKNSTSGGGSERARMNKVAEYDKVLIANNRTPKPFKK